MASNVVGPLTNIFTPPASCSSIYITCPVWSTRGREDRGTTFCMLTSSASCDSSDNVVPDPACWASGEEFIAIRTLTSEAQPVYFPALECPSGLTIAHTVRDGTVSGVYSTTLVSVADTDTAAYCCPSEYDAPGVLATSDWAANDWMCRFFMDDSLARPRVVNLCPDGTASLAWAGTGAAPNPTDASKTVAVVIEEPGVFLNLWGVEDASLTTATTASTSGTESSDSAGTGSDTGSVPRSSSASFSSPTETQPSDGGDTGSPDSGSGLSTGAKAAIGVVIPLFVIVLLLLAWWFWRRRRRRPQLQDEPSDEPPMAAVYSRQDDISSHDKAELEGTVGRVLRSEDLNHVYEKPELSASHTQISQLDSTPTRQELSNRPLSPGILEMPSHSAIPRRPVPGTEGKPQSMPMEGISEEAGSSTATSAAPVAETDAAARLERLQELERAKARLKEAVANMQSLAELERKQAEIQAEIERLK